MRGSGGAEGDRPVECPCGVTEGDGWWNITSDVVASAGCAGSVVVVGVDIFAFVGGS